MVGADGNLGPTWCEVALGLGGFCIAIGLSAYSDDKLNKLVTSAQGKLQLNENNLYGGFPGDFLDSISNFKFDGVVFNMGIDSPPGSNSTELHQFGFSTWEKTLNLNLNSTVACLNQIIPFMKENSSIVILGSMYTVVSPDPFNYLELNDGKGFTKNPAYSASKSALLSVVKTYAIELAPRIRINMLSPGAVLGKQDSTFINRISKRIPLGNLVNSEVLKGHMTYLLSEQSEYMTGQNIVVDGGYTLW